MTLICILNTVISYIGLWMVFKKMGRQGWEGIIPIYNLNVWCEELYGNGWKFLLLLIPFYNIYFSIKMDIDLAKGFNQSAGFGVGMFFFPCIFLSILGFGQSVYGDGSKANTEDDILTGARDILSGSKKDDTVEKLTKLNELREKGLITEEEYLGKRDEILRGI